MQLRSAFLLFMCLGLFCCAYTIEIVQGSILKSEDIAKLQPGMNKAQVEYILGTPSTINVLNRDRWDYVYRSKHGRKVYEKKGYLLFRDNQLETISMEEFSAQ